MTHSEETKRKISETLKAKGIHPPWHLFPHSGGLKKGNVPWNKGKKWSEEVKEKFRLAKLGKKRGPHSIETRKLIRDNNLGQKRSLETKLKQSLVAKKRLQNPMSHPMWAGGISKRPYPFEWTEELKARIRKRDNYTCQNCGMTEEEHLSVYGKVLHVHHIDYDKSKCTEENLITLDLGCNIRANVNREVWTKFYQTKIGKIYGKKTN